MEMELENPTDGENRASADAGNGDGDGSDPPHPSGCFTDDVDSACSTPYVSAPSSPGRGGPSGYFYSAPASPMHFVLSSSPYGYAGTGAGSANAAGDGLMSGSFEFEFSARFGGTSSGAAAAGSMISADELFLNGQIRPMNLSSHLQRPQVLAPLLDLEGEEDDEDANEAPTVRGRDLKMRNRSLRRRARSMSPLRNAAPFQWHDEGDDLNERSGKQSGNKKGEDLDLETEPDHMDQLAAAATPSVSASSSRSSSTSSSRSSKRWVFLKDLLYRSKSEGRGNTKDKFWNAISFSPSKERSSSLFFRDRFTKPSPAPGAPPSSTVAAASSAPSDAHKPKQKNAGSSASASTSKKPSSASSKPANGVGKRRVSSRSPHERHYTANRAQAEEMRKKTFLPYRQGLLGCLWFSSRSYGAMNGLARTLNPVSSR